MIDIPIGKNNITNVSILTMVIMFLITSYYINHLPQEIPVHINSSGLPDKFGSKNGIWLIPMIAVGVFVLLTGLCFLCKMLIQSSSANLQVRDVVELLLVLNLYFQLNFLFIVSCTIGIALGKIQGLGTYYSTMLISGLVLISIYYLQKSVKYAMGH